MSWDAMQCKVPGRTWTVLALERGRCSLRDVLDEAGGEPAAPWGCVLVFECNGM